MRRPLSTLSLNKYTTKRVYKIDMQRQKNQLPWDSILFIVLVGLCVVSIVVAALTQEEQVGELTWIKFPHTSATPLIQRVSYKGENIYTGIMSPAIDINLNYQNLLIIDTYEGRKTYYDLEQEKILDNTSVNWEEYYTFSSGNDDRYITNIDSVYFKTEWQERLLSHQKRNNPQQDKEYDR